MNATHTASGPSALSPGPPHASGQSIFWALVTLAVNAMLQPSVTGYLWSNDHFEGSLWPHRSSPFVCAVDTLAELYGMATRTRVEALDEDAERRVPSIGRGAITLRLAAFCVGVVPQAFKLFSIRGIPITQAVAGTFLAASLPGLVNSVRSMRPHQPVVSLAKKVTASDSRDELMVVVFLLFALAPHVAAIVLLWHGHLLEYWQSSAPQDFKNLLSWFGGISWLIWAFILPLGILVGALKVVRPALIVLPFMSICSTLTHNETQTSARMGGNISQAAIAVATLGWVSFVPAYLLYILSSFLRTKIPSSTGPEIASGEGIPLQHLGDPVDAAESHATTTFSTYTDAATQTTQSAALSSSSTAQNSSSSAIALTDGQSRPAEHPAGLAARAKDELELEPWTVVGMLWAVELLAPTLRDKEDLPPARTLNKGCQTDVSVPAGSAAPQSSSSINSQPAGGTAEPPHSCPWCLPVRTLCFAARIFGTLYLEYLIFSRPARARDTETAEPPLPFAIRWPRPYKRALWKTALFYVFWPVSVLVLTYARLYQESGKAIAWVLEIYDWDVAWIAFAIANVVTAALYYLIIFDGAKTFSPAWVDVLG